MVAIEFGMWRSGRNGGAAGPIKPVTCRGIVEMNMPRNHSASAPWPEFIRACVRYRQSVDEHATNAPRTNKASKNESLDVIPRCA